jgi:dTDP-4-amino-4,6-dideoxygalactose transaminase
MQKRFSLPMHTELTKEQQDYIIQGVKDFIATPSN